MKRLKHLICHLTGHNWSTACTLCEEARYHEIHVDRERCTRCRVARAHIPSQEQA